MELWTPVTAPGNPDPAPALSRGLMLLGVLGKNGACSLQTLAQQTGYPKTSVLRLLKSLCAMGAIHCDPRTKRYVAQVRLQPRRDQNARFMDHIRQTMATLAETVGHVCELYRPEDVGLRMTERAEPQAPDVMAVARIGHMRNLHEADALSSAYRCHPPRQPPAPRRGLWYWDRHARKVPITLASLQRRLKNRERNHVFVDPGINPHGVRRYAVALLKPPAESLSSESAASLWGILAIAQVVPPHAAEIDSGCLEKLAETCRHLTDARTGLLDFSQQNQVSQKDPKRKQSK